MLARHGRLSSALIEAAPDVHACSVFSDRFGSLPNAYVRVGYAMTEKQRRASLRFKAEAARRTPKCTLSDEALVRRAQQICARSGTLTARLLDADPDGPSYHTYVRRFGSLTALYRRCGYLPNKRQAMKVAAQARAQDGKRFTQDVFLDAEVHPPAPVVPT